MQLSDNYAQELLKQIKTEAGWKSGKTAPIDSAVIAIKIIIERLLEDVSPSEESKRLIKTLTYFSNSNLSQELLVACAETFHPDFEKVCL